METARFSPMTRELSEFRRNKLTMGQYYVAYTKSLRYKFKARVRSNVTVFLLLNFLFCFILPLILSYASRGFWIKQFSFREQPTIKFKYQYLIVLEHEITEDFQTTLVCTTYQPLIDSLTLHTDHCSSIKVVELDDDRDGKVDGLNMDVEITNVTDLDITAVHLFLVFDYKIYEECVYNTEIMIHSSSKFSQSIGRFDLISGINTNMKKAIDCTPRQTTKQNVSIFSGLSPLLDKPYLARIISSYASRMVKVDLSNTYSVAGSKINTAVNEPLLITIDIRYDEQEINYKTRFWQLMKWAWLQYFPLLALFILLSKKIKKFVFQNRVLQTIKVNPEDDE